MQHLLYILNFIIFILSYYFTLIGYKAKTAPDMLRSLVGARLDLSRKRRIPFNIKSF